MILTVENISKGRNFLNASGCSLLTYNVINFFYHLSAWLNERKKVFLVNGIT
jgi:hypothetical protein